MEVGLIKQVSKANLYLPVFEYSTVWIFFCFVLFCFFFSLVLFSFGFFLYCRYPIMNRLNFLTTKDSIPRETLNFQALLWKNNNCLCLWILTSF